MHARPSSSHLRRRLLRLALAVMMMAAAPADAADAGGSVHYADGDEHVHILGCPRLWGELSWYKSMTMQEAEAQAVTLCPYCPGSTTKKPKLPVSWVQAPSDEVSRREFRPDERAPLVSMGDDGRLVYRSFSDRGDRIPDFSHCGYRRSEVPIPQVAVVETLAPPGGEAMPQPKLRYPVGVDSFATVQAALDRVAAREADANGFRGAVLLEQGTWYFSTGLHVRSGVVLRGEGDGPEGTVLVFTDYGDAGVTLGGDGGGTTSEVLTPVTGRLSLDQDAGGEDDDPTYLLTLEDGGRFAVSDPRFAPEVKLAPFVGSRVTLMMKAVVTTRGEASTSRLKHDMPYEVKAVEEGQEVPPLDSDLSLPLLDEHAASSLIADAYVPTGSTRLTLEDASGFAVGDPITITKTTNEVWTELIGCGERIRHIRAGKEGAGKRPWGLQAYRHPRRITAIDGNVITIDVMLPQSIAVEHGGGKVTKATRDDDGTRCGVEHLRIVSNYDGEMKRNSKDADYQNLRNGVDVQCTDSWVRNCTVLHVWFAAVNLEGAQFCTVRDCRGLEPVGPVRGGKRYTFNIGGGAACNLVYRCYAEDGRHDFVVGARNMGPNVFLECTAVRGGQSEPHHRWGTGTLYDNITLKDGGTLAAINRGDSGSGHGWAGANTVFWNSDARAVTVFDPETEGENNFAFGYRGEALEEYNTGSLKYANTRSGYWGTPWEGAYYGHALMGNGHIESPDRPIEPGSLFRQQLIDRIGAEQAATALE